MDRLFVFLQHVLPQHAISRVVHWGTRVRAVWFKNTLIRVFIRALGVDMRDAVRTEPEAYEHFNAFFTRALRPGARPLPDSPTVVASPVDGTISASGLAAGTELFQAKDRRFTLEELLGDSEMAAEFGGGAFVTIYLAPYDYHRIHMPTEGRLTRMDYIPGRLFSVNAATVRSVARLFARNERVVCRFITANGPMVMVLVGALNVGSIETVWAGEVAPGRPRNPRTTDYHGNIKLGMGEEMGRFNMGSTVILLFPSGRVSLANSARAGETVRVGQSLGEWRAYADQASSAAT